MPPRTFSDLVEIFIRLIQATLPILMGLALLAFIWGLVKFIARSGGDEKAITEGRKLMMWGLIALFILVSMWGILRFFYASLGFSRPFGFPLLPT